MLFFLDETGSDRRDAARKFGYGLRGKPIKSAKLFVRGKHLTAIAAMCTEGLLDYKIVDEAVDADKYQEFIDQCLLPKLHSFNGVNPRSVIVLDNATIHHVDHTVQSFEELGVLVNFLPPYSPDMNPIEEMFAKVKSVMKANETVLDGADLETLIMMGFASITPSDCRSWITHAGYS